MVRYSLILGGIFGAFTCSSLAEDLSFDQLLTSTLQSHCFHCHGEDDQLEGDVDLRSINRDRLAEDLDLTRSLIDVLDLEEMPPEDEPELPQKLRAKLVSGLKEIWRTSVTEQETYAHAPLRRMNRFQYNNAVTDLFELNCIVFTLPERMMRDHKNYFRPSSGKMADVVTVGSRPLGKSQMIEPRLAGVTAFPQDARAEHGFDNRGDHLSLSPLLMESFLNLGRSITDSRDFGPKRVGIWDTFFADPGPMKDRTLQVERRLEPFLTRAFRRPVQQDVLDRYVAFVSTRLDEGMEFTDAMKSVAAATIASPKFLYVYDTSSEGSVAKPVDDLELASRLSFFLWGSIPDQVLLDLADSSQLGQPEVLSAQVDRMLRDRRIKRFCDSFPTQWLQLERIISSVPNREKFPGFYFSKYRDSMHMMLEPLLLFETVLIEDHPITQLIDSDFTYRSTILQDAYQELGGEAIQGKPKGGGVTVLHFHRLPVTDRRTGGVITNAAVMTMTSGPERTQPITRGAWIASVIFNHPPEPPPADVPALDEKPPQEEEHLTLRERLSLHRERSDCKGCHEQIDPLGFALENYNPIGVWRDKYENDRTVDASGTLFRKHAFHDVVEFKDAILAEKDRFTRALAGHMLSFGLARELDSADQLALDKIASRTAEQGYRMQALIKEVVMSDPFLSKADPSKHK